MFRNLKKKKTKKISIEKKLKNQFFSSCPSFIFALYTLISLSVQIILKKNFTYPDRSQKVESILRISKKLDVNSRNGTLTKTQKTPSIL